MMLMAGAKIALSSLSLRKETPRAIAEPEIAPAKWPSSPPASSG